VLLKIPNPGAGYYLAPLSSLDSISVLDVGEVNVRWTDGSKTVLTGDQAADLIRQCEVPCAPGPTQPTPAPSGPSPAHPDDDEGLCQQLLSLAQSCESRGGDFTGRDAAECLRGIVGDVRTGSLAIPAPAPLAPAPIEINPDVAALLVRLEEYAAQVMRPARDSFDPGHADDLRRAVELIRYGRRATGQPDAGQGEDDSR